MKGIEIIKRAAAEGIDFFGLKAAIRALGERMADRMESGDPLVAYWNTPSLDLSEHRQAGGVTLSDEAGVRCWQGMRADVAREIGAEMSSTFHAAFDTAVSEMQQSFLAMEVVWPS